MRATSIIRIAPVVFAALIPASKPRPLFAVEPARSQSDTLVFAALAPHSTQKDCGDRPEIVCRVKRQLPADLLRARLASGINVWRDGDELTFVTQSAAESVDLSGGLQYPMSRLAGTDIWTVTLHVSPLDSVVLSYFFIPKGPRVVMPAKFDPLEWRGPLAPRPLAKATKLQGRVVVDSLQSRFLTGMRSLVIYLPPSRNGEPISGVVYAGDGGAVHGLAPIIDTLIVQGKLPRVMVVGIVSAMRKAEDPADYDPRGMEYLWGLEEKNARFLAHERFWLEEVIPLAESRYGAPADRAHRAAWGISDSGGWAIQMGLRHPEIVGQVIGFSPGGVHGQIEPGTRLDLRARFYLEGGKLESAFNTIAHSWADSLSSRGFETRLREPAGGHDFLVWRELFPEALAWAFPTR